jgi:gas vesicle protein
MESEGRYNGCSMVMAVLGGAAVGAAAALLLAPRSGRETRAAITGGIDTAKDTIGRVPEALRQASHAAMEALGEPEPAVHHGRHSTK